MKPYNCKHCGETNKFLFGDWNRNLCKKCNAERALKRYHEKKKLCIQSANNYYDNNIINIRFLAARTRAKNKNIEFNITREYIEFLLNKQNNKCIYSGIEFINDRKGLYSLSIDRIDNNKGYIRGNIQLICSSVNSMKNNMEESVFIDIIKKIENNLKINAK